ncbi:MAG: DUF2330 domain-containing protein [Polyangiaceae bacterium]|nr:DUF2330 domain-containing protein [Polyangiaceae bacterium]MCW5791859.1 DUF2330 domain-containing protein [Polyangiaceae bacterium]
MKHSPKRWAALAALIASTAAAPHAEAFPGFFVGKDDQARTLSSAHVVIMQREGRTAVTLMADYDGPTQEFAVVIPVPADIALDRVVTLKRDFVSRIDQLSAPRFHEFWEKDPCEPGATEQDWERSLAASSDTDFLGGGAAPKPTVKVAKEMSLTVEPEFKHASEYRFTLLSAADSANVAGWLGGQGYKLPSGAAEALKPYSDGKTRFLVAVVDPSKVELMGDGSAQLSPIRFWTEEAYSKIPAKLGLLSSGGKHQELVILTLDPERRFEAKNYDNVVPPTNLAVDFVVKERMGEFYAGLHDLLLAKNPRGILNEYAWSTRECGQPCPNPPLYIHELLSLGGDVFEATLSKEVLSPAPPERTEEEKAVYDALKKPDEKKAADASRQEVARRKALVERHEYLLTRLHHRYDAKTLDQDIELQPASAVKGGVELPKGPEGELPTSSAPADKSTLQTRYVHLHPDKSVLKCDTPERWRWGKAPRTYRGLRKVWIAEDLARKKRTEIVPAKVVQTAVPALGLPGKVTAAPDAGATPTEEKSEKSGGCSVSPVTALGRRAAATERGWGGFGIALLAALGLAARRRRRR